MRCDQIFNFKKKLREHVREQHAKKFVNNSSLSIDTVKSICEIEKRSIVIDTFVLQVSHISFTTSRSQITFEITSSTSSNLSIEAFKVVSKSTKNESNQCSFVSMFSFSRTFESEHHEFAIRKSESESSLLKILSNKLEFDIFIATSKQKFESVMIFETVTSSKSSHLSSNASKIVSKSMKNKSTQCSITSSKSFSSQTFESERQKVFIQKLFIFDASLSNDTVKSVCESEKNSAVICSIVSFTSLSSIFKRNCLICRIDVFSVKEHYLESSSCHEALRHRLEQQLARRAHQREQETQKQVELIEQESQKQAEVEKTISQFVSSICLNFSIATFKIMSKSMKSASNQEVLCVRAVCKRCKRDFNFNNKFHEHIREHHARTLKVLIFESSHQNLDTKLQRNQQ